MREATGDRCVYFHMVPGQGPFYVGMGTIQRAYSKHSRNKDWHRVVNSVANYNIFVFSSGLSVEDAANLEKECISYFGLSNLVNKSLGGQHSAYGMRHTEDAKRRIGLNSATKRPEIRARLRIQMRGSGNPMFNRTHSAKAKKAISDARSDDTLYLFTKENLWFIGTRAFFRAVTGAKVWQSHDAVKSSWRGWKGRTYA